MQYSTITPEFKTEFYRLAEEATHILITSHISPDEDAIASVLSMYGILASHYPTKSIRVVLSSEPIERLNMFVNYDKIEFVDDVANYLKDTDLLIGLDANQYGRFTKQPHLLGGQAKNPQATMKTICIDHHASELDPFTLSLVVPTMSSNAELIYLSVCDKETVTPALAEVFMLGILADTGNFSYLKKNQTGTLVSAKELMDIGDIQIDEFQARFRHTSTREFKVLQELVKNTEHATIAGWPSFQYAYVTEDFAKDYTKQELGAGKDKYQGQYIRRIQGYPWGFTLTPRGGSVRFSGRSMPSGINVRRLVERLGIGAGHDLAAGGTFENMTVLEAIEKIKGWMRENREEK